MKEEHVVASNVSVANSFFKRLKGLLGRKGLLLGEGMLLFPCKQVHTWFMKFTIDVIFIDKKGQIVELISCMQPGTISSYIKESYQVLELNSGDILKYKISTKDELSILFIKN